MDATGSALLSCLNLDRPLDIGGEQCELTDCFFNPVIFQCGLEKKKLSIFKVKKIQGSLLVNEFSEFQIFLPGRVLENHFRRACYGSFIEESALCAHTNAECLLRGLWPDLR